MAGQSGLGAVARYGGQVSAAPELLVYTTATCGHCWSLKRWLTGERIAFREIEITDDPAAQQVVRTAANGYMSVPTVVFPDGTVLVEPSPAQVRATLTASGEATVGR